MTTRKLASTAAAVSLAGAAVLGMSVAPAFAQDADYPPASGTDVAGVSDDTATAGQSITADTGTGFCPPGAAVLVEVSDTDIVAEGTADEDGKAEFTFDAPSEPGDYTITFTCEDGEFVDIDFTVSAAATGGAGNGNGTGTGGGVALPRTGSDSIIPLTLTGLGLVGVGGGIVVAARRRRQDMPGGLA